MMKNVDYIIVGDGYAALFFAHQLVKNNKSFVLFSEGRKSASQVSAGIINPVVLKKFTTFWKAQEQIDFLKKTLSEIETYTGKNYLIDENIRRIFHDEKEKELWLKRSQTEELKPFLSTEFSEINGVKNPFGIGKVEQSARLDVAGFFNDFLKFLEEKGHLINERFDYSKLDPSKNQYKEFEFKNIIFAEGVGVSENPYFKNIPLNPNKGHHIRVKLSENPQNNFTVKKKHFLFPLDEDLHFYGGTYDREQLHHKIDDSAIEQLINGLGEIYTQDFEVVEKHFGFRPTVKDRRPLLGNHSEFQNFYVFNGLGARGILNGCYFADVLFRHIENCDEIPAEVDLKRFDF